jgi:pilus assembly protein CpaF
MGIRIPRAPEEKTEANTASIAFDHTDPNPNGARPPASLPDLGILNGALSDPEVTEIMVNDLRNIAIEKRGQIIVTPIRFKSLDELDRVVQILALSSGKRISPENPLCVTTLPDGSRVHIAAPPVTDYGPCITIRRFPKHMNLSQLLQSKMLDVRMAQFLSACIQGRQNILISGGTASGKTTLLNALLPLVPPHERVITIEDSSEIPYVLPNQVKLTASIGADSAESAIPLRELIPHALRMRPDRVILGECRGTEALDFIQAMNSGHRGSMMTIHANSPREALLRLETLLMSSGTELPLPAIRRHISGALDLILQIRRFPSGVRKLVSIQEVTGSDPDTLVLHEVFSFEPKNPLEPQSDEGTFRFNAPSSIADRLTAQGIRV